MGEFFELTFFAKHNGKELDELPLLRRIMGIEEGQHIAPHKNKFSFLFNRGLYFVAFSGCDYNEYELSVAEVHFTKENFNMQLSQMLSLIEGVFCACPFIDIVTGAYEVTDSYLEDLVCFEDLFQRDMLSRFPFLFCRRPEQLGFAAMEKHGAIWYCVQQGGEIQDIFED